MKKLLLFLIFIFLISPVHAEWILTGESDTQKNFIRLPVKKVKEVVMVWDLIDYSTPQVFPQQNLENLYSSSIALTEVDCKNETFRLSASHLYSGHMQTGTIIRSSSFSAKDKNYEMFEPIIPNSQISYFMEIACNKIKYVIKDKKLYPLNN
jgi:hypothetical protein